MRRSDDKNRPDNKKRRIWVLFMTGIIAVLIVVTAVLRFNRLLEKEEDSRVRDSLLEWTGQQVQQQ